MIVHLTIDEVDQIRAWGIARNETTSKITVTGHAIKAPKAGVTSDIEGVSGEYVCAKVLRAKWTPLGGGPDAGVDLRLQDGRTGAAKFRKHMPPPKVWPPFHAGAISTEIAPRFSTHTIFLKCAVGVFTQGVPGDYGRSVQIVGWMSKEEFNDPRVHHLYDYGWGLGPQPAVYDYQLHPIEELIPKEAPTL